MGAFFARSVVLGSLVLAASAGAAHASSVTVAGGVMTINANAGEENDVSFGAAGSDERGPLVRVNDSGSEDTIPNGTTRRIVAGGSCNQTSDGRGAFCPTNGLTSIVVNLGDEDDAYDGHTMAVDTELTLGDGDDVGSTGRGSDVLHGGNGADTLDGGPASSGGSLTTTTGADALDTFDAGPGTDTIDIGRSTGADDVSGGPDADTVTYGSRSFAAGVTTGVTITIDDVADDGRQSSGGEGDNIRTDVEKVVGSRNNDQLFGSTGPDVLEGGLGVDSFKGNGGADTFLLRDGVRDNSFCIDSNDTVDKDLLDPFIFNCVLLQLRPGIVIPTQLVTIGAIDEGPNVRIARGRLRIDRSGHVRVKLSCPAALPRRCAGRLTLRAATRRARLLGSRRYRVRPGKRRTLVVDLGKRAQRRAQRRGYVFVEAVERGVHGLKTTLALRALQRRSPQ